MRTAAKYNYIKELLQLYFIQVEDATIFRGAGPIKLGLSHAPINTLTSYTLACPFPMVLLSHRDSNHHDLQAIRDILRPHHMRCDWYTASPDVLDVAHGRVLIDANGSKRVARGGRKLTAAEAVEVFRLVHGTGLGYETIAARYGVSRLAVGNIARGVSYAGLFRREPAAAVIGPDGVIPGSAGVRRADGGIDGPYYISEARPGAPRYRVVPGKRGRW